MDSKNIRRQVQCRLSDLHLLLHSWLTVLLMGTFFSILGSILLFNSFAEIENKAFALPFIAAFVAVFGHFFQNGQILRSNTSILSNQYIKKLR